MRGLVLWADAASPNLGVRALGQGTRVLMERAWPGIDVEMHNYGAGSAPTGTGRFRSFLRHGLPRSGVLRRWLSGFDVILDTRSGDSFADIYGLRRLGLMTAMAELAAQQHIPVVMSPQTIGPFDTALGRVLARRSLNQSVLVMARDSLSAGHAAALGRSADVLTSDVVFALPQPHPRGAPPPKHPPTFPAQPGQTRPGRSGHPDVLLNISGLLWNGSTHVDAVAYRRTVTGVYDTIRRTGREVIPFAHVLDSPGTDNDVSAVRDFAAGHPGNPDPVVPTGLGDLRELLSSAGLVIGSRMHACLNALSVGTPAIPLAYSRKFAPLMADLGWPYTIDLRTTPDAAAAVGDLLDRPDLDRDVGPVAERGRDLLGAAVGVLRRVA